MRIVKEHDERKNEILDVSERLFSEKGYGKCSVNEIINEIGIAKGTFYHYFKSKEEVLDAIVERTTAMIIERAKLIGENKEMPPSEKLFNIFLSLRLEDKQRLELLDEMHKTENVLMHQKSLVSSVEGITPILVEIVKEGMEAGAFKCDYPEEYMRIFMTSTLTLMDEGIFSIPMDKQEKMFQALISMLENMLGLGKNEIWNVVAPYYR